MRIKTDAKRQSIIKTAARMFEEVGFESASMAMISAKIGGSKTTLYNYFSSKEELFIEVMCDLIDQQTAKLQPIIYKGDITKTLTAYGTVFVEFTTSPWVMDMLTTIIGFKKNREIQKNFYARAHLASEKKLAQIMAASIGNGELSDAPPLLMARQFKALLKAEYFNAVLMNVQKSPSSSQKRRWIKIAVNAFLKIYHHQKVRKTRAPIAG